MPIVTVEMIEGRTVEQKKQLVREITEAFVKIGAPAEAVHIIIHDMARHNYSQGGKLHSEKK